MGGEDSPASAGGLSCLRGAGVEVAGALRCCRVCLRVEKDAGVVRVGKGRPGAGTGPFALSLNKANQGEGMGHFTGELSKRISCRIPLTPTGFESSLERAGVYS